MKILKLILPFLFLLTMLILPSVVMADPEFGCNPDEPCPIDTNVVWLVVAAILIAAFKYYSSVKKKLAV